MPQTLILKKYRMEKIKIIMISVIFLLSLIVVNASELNEDYSIELISNITLINDFTEGDGNIIDPPRSYLFEGEQLDFYVQVFYSSGVDQLDYHNVYVTTNGYKMVYCIESGKINDQLKNYHCILTIETSESMHGDSAMAVVVKSIDGEEKMIELGRWFLNPYISIGFTSDTAKFNILNGTSRSYSDTISVINTVEEGSEVKTVMYISGYQTGSGSCSVNLDNLYYYAENGVYNTLNDPRADEEGYIPINYGDNFNSPYQFKDKYEIILNHKTVQENETINIKFKFNVPDNCENINFPNIIIWSAADGSWGPVVGKILNFESELVESFDLNNYELSILGNIDFGQALPGTTVYSDPVYLSIGPENEYNIPLNMYISGTDFYDSSSSSARCPVANQLALDNLYYYAENGVYNTLNDPRADEEGYVQINYGIGLNNPFNFYNGYELIQVQGINLPSDEPYYYPANSLSPEDNMTLKFRLNVPAPCTGNFDVGRVFIFGTIDGEDYITNSIGFNLKVSEDVKIEDVSNFTLVIDGEEKHPDVSNLTIPKLLDYPYDYLFEGDQINFDVHVYTPNGIREIEKVVFTTGDTAGFGNNEMSVCTLSEIIDSLNAIYYCSWDVDNINEAYGHYNTGVDTILFSGAGDFGYLGLYAFNLDNPNIPPENETEFNHTLKELFIEGIININPGTGVGLHIQPKDIFNYANIIDVEDRFGTKLFTLTGQGVATLNSLSLPNNNNAINVFGGFVGYGNTKTTLQVLNSLNNIIPVTILTAEDSTVPILNFARYYEYPYYYDVGSIKASWYDSPYREGVLSFSVEDENADREFFSAHANGDGVSATYTVDNLVINGNLNVTGCIIYNSTGTPVTLGDCI